MRQDIAEKSSRNLATTDKATLVISKQPDGKMRVTSGSWESEKVFLRDQVLEVQSGRLHVARKARFHDERDPPIEPYDPYGPGAAAEGSIIDDAPSSVTPQ